ncbi:hypothetical protein GCM10022232_53350 [Streptomyces plumbiresistens]|uniref:Uncharacterized protein n=1 Tax=Streptomyces plumbiresistens TaxID=511811 RepID=A0ABP7S4V6_9ACTN
MDAGFRCCGTGGAVVGTEKRLVNRGSVSGELVEGSGDVTGKGELRQRTQVLPLLWMRVPLRSDA